jgi:hypothetical protein
MSGKVKPFLVFLLGSRERESKVWPARTREPLSFIDNVTDSPTTSLLLVMSSTSHKHNRAPSLSLQTTGTSQNDPLPAGTAPKSQKQMTKAERREIQERQRAAKAAKASATAQQSGGSAAKPSNLTQSTSSHSKKSGKGNESPVQTRGSVAVGPSGPPNKSTKESKAAAEEFAERSRGLRIFSHFALQKPAGHVAKGDVHPAIDRLGLMFAEFKICGANARCIATLSVFKRVRHFPWPCEMATLISVHPEGHTRLHNATE